MHALVHLSSPLVAPAGEILMASIESITTAEDLLHARDVGRCELVLGELVMMSPAGSRHGENASSADFAIIYFRRLD